MSVQECPFHKMRPELAALPSRMANLPLDKRGYPVPWFVDWINEEPEFRAMDGSKLVKAVREKLCWVRGQSLGQHLAFVIGPMCGINRTTAEPPCHLECAQWSALNCPFLTQREKRRREDEACNNEMMEQTSPGFAITRQPGCAMVWVTKSYRVWTPDNRGVLFEIGEPTQMHWYAHGREATRAEVEASVESGLPILAKMAETEDGGMEELNRRAAWLRERYPVPVDPAVQAAREYDRQSLEAVKADAHDVAGMEDALSTPSVKGAARG